MAPTAVPTTWKVVGGEDKGGIIVRKGKERFSREEATRLSTGALIQEREVHNDDRLCYELLDGYGPPQGWVSIRTGSKELVVRHRTTPLDVKVDVKAERVEKDEVRALGVTNGEKLRPFEAERMDREGMNLAAAACNGVITTGSPDLESRLAALEQLAERQQAQIKQLSNFSARLLQEVSDLSEGCSALRVNHGLLCDCLVSSKLLLPEGAGTVFEVREWKRLGSRMHPIQGVLEISRAATLLRRLLGGGGFARAALASRGFARLRGAAWGLPLTETLDDGVWLNMRRHEPLGSVLDQWEKSQTVQAVVGSLSWVDVVVGKPKPMKFADVQRLLAQIGMPLDHFVNKFRVLPTLTGCSDPTLLRETVDTILKKFALQQVEGKDRMSCRDLYRMLEIVGFPLQRFKLLFPGVATIQDSPGDGSFLMIGNYKIRRQIGQGFKGARCYLGEHSKDGTLAAVKWPAPMDEVSIAKDIQKRAPKDCLGFPQLLSSGIFRSKSYLVTELLGSPLTHVFRRLESHSPQQRWLMLRVVGRLVLRRLQALHSCGYVHCDVSPDNILLGRLPTSSPGAEGNPTLYLIDFEVAQRYPGGGKVEGNIGSSEWSSIRSADLVERLPVDDLEALGWVLLNGLVGPLPWFEWLGAAYRDWESKWTRAQAVKQVQRAKVRLLDRSAGSRGWRKSVGMPDELVSFLQSCGQTASSSSRYPTLLALLGGDALVSEQEAEKRDLELLARHIAALF